MVGPATTVIDERVVNANVLESRKMQDLTLVATLIPVLGSEATILALVVLVIVLPHVRKMGHVTVISVKIPEDQKLSVSVDIIEKTAPMSEVITAVKEGREYPRQ
jgi:hypothetical protein